MAKKFSKREAIKFGWQTMKQNFWFFVGLLVVAGIVMFVPPFLLHRLLEEDIPVVSSAVDLLRNFLEIWISLGLIKITLNFCDNLKSKIADLFSRPKLFFRYLFAVILYTLTVFVGLILLIVPGIYFGIRLQFYGFFIVDKKAGIVESLKGSWQITKGSFWNLFFFGLLLALINLAGFAVFLVGLFVTIPTTLVASAFVYRKLLGIKTEAVQVPVPAAPQGPMSPMTPSRPTQPPIVSSSTA